MPNTKALRYAHSDGHTDLCFEGTGKYLLTCGSDGDVRVWEGFDDDDAVSHRAGDRAFAILYNTNTIQAHTFPDGAPDGILTRFTAPVNHMVINSSGKTLVAGSSDFTIKVVKVDNCEHKSLRGHEAPVLSVALDPQEEYVASSSCDGSVVIWKIEDQSQLKILNILPKSNDVSLSKSLCRLTWDSTGKFLFIPVEKEIKIFERDTWNEVGKLVDETVAGIFSLAVLSPNATQLAVGSTDGHLLVFDINSKTVVERYKHPKGFTLTSLAWNPQVEGQIAFCDKEGQLGLLEDIAKSSSNDTTSKSAVKKRAKETHGIFDDDDDDFLLEATQDDNEPKAAEPMDEDDLSNDGTAGSKVLKPLDDSDDDAASSVSDALVLPKPVIHTETYKPTPLQNAFQAGSTPVHLSSRFMVWNSVGIIKQYNTEEENSIDIEFHDTSIHHAMHITNNYNYTMADMSTEAVILASEKDDDSPSKLTCMHFGSWDSSKEWTISLPDNEEIQAITIGEGWIAIATDSRMVRIITVGGIQKQIFSIAGPVVCMAAHSNQLLVVYHRGTGIPGDQCLGVILQYVDGSKRNLLNMDSLPLSRKSSLSWLGFSAEGTPFYMDSAGVVRMLNRKFGNNWVQVANTKSHAKGKSDHYWIVGVHENPQQLRCIPCKGSRYPATLPRPAVAILPFSIPLCELNTEKSQYEESLSRSQLFANHFDHWTSQGYEFEESLKEEVLKPVQESLMKLFALSARSDREYRALEVCELMPDQHTLQLAIKYASRLKHIQLAERISELVRRKLEEEEAGEEEQEEEDPYSQPIVERRWAQRNGNSGDNAEEDQEEEQEEDGVNQYVGEEEVDSTPSGPVLNLKSSKSEKTSKPQFQLSGRSNPFRVSTPSKGTGSTKGTQVFDSMTRKKAEKTTPLLTAPTGKSKNNSKTQSSQAKIFPSKKTKTTKSENINNATSEKIPSAFDLWLAENKESILEENPDVSEEDVVSIATEKFRQIPKEERQNDSQKDNKKRKREEDTSENKETDVISKKKKDTTNIKPLSQKTNSKLASFTFQKD
ncbi:hypothetical protein KUTeg_013432 [Tegillarca granosa]|uniref:HMG box domain-containing protein n=1 Tax=Tegillarca granosa TaxID=220873 RepID=A0ABQ9ETN3_TEGGR|nr:hypothetical protein KUTeg_013432 [Tegillarca granosa]